MVDGFPATPDFTSRTLSGGGGAAGGGNDVTPMSCDVSISAARGMSDWRGRSSDVSSWLPQVNIGILSSFAPDPGAPPPATTAQQGVKNRSIFI